MRALLFLFGLLLLGCNLALPLSGGPRAADGPTEDAPLDARPADAPLDVSLDGPSKAEAAQLVDVLAPLDAVLPASDLPPTPDKGPPVDQKPSPDQTPPTGTWTTMKSGVTETLHAVWGTAYNNVFAVGDNGKVLHYDGNTVEAWALLANTVSLAGLRGVSGHGSDPTTAYAVGLGNTALTCTTGGCAPLTCASGTSLPKTAYYDVHAVGQGDLFLAGSDLMNNTPVVHRWINTVCSSGTVTSPVNATTINAVWAGASNDAYAVADNGSIFHFNGSGWSPMGSPLPVTLHDVYGAGALILAVGQYHSVYSHDQTGSWSSELTPPAVTDLLGVWTNGPQAHAVGANATVLERSATGAWSALPVSTVDASTVLRGVWGSKQGNHLFVVGDNGTILHYVAP